MVNYKYDHNHFRSEDPLAARKFWEEIFGAKLIQESEIGGALSFRFDLNGMILLVSGLAEGEDLVRAESGTRYGLDHFGLLVDDIEEAEAELRAHNAEFIREPWEVRPGVKIAFIKGPDNISIELIERK